MFTWPSLGWYTMVPPQYPEAAQHLCSASWWHWWHSKDLKTLQTTKTGSSCAATCEVFTYYSKDGGRNWLMWLIVAIYDHFLLVLCLDISWIGNDLTWSFLEWWNAYVLGCWLQGSGLKPKPMPGATAGPRRRQFQSHVTYKKVSNCDDFAYMDLSGNHMKSTWDGKWSIIQVSKGDLKVQVLQGLRGVGIVSWLMPHSLANCKRVQQTLNHWPMAMIIPLSTIFHYIFWIW